MITNLKDFFKSLRLNEQKISQVLGGLVVVVVGILLYNYFSSVNKQAEIAQKATEEAAKAKQTHVVAKGEFLWEIAQQYYNDGYQWTKIAEANNLTNPDILVEGQELTLPQLEVKPEIAAAVTSATSESDTPQPTEYTVAVGDTLWSISVQTYADGYQWTKIWEANKDKIANSNIIEVGQVLVLPR